MTEREIKDVRYHKGTSTDLDFIAWQDSLPQRAVQQWMRQGNYVLTFRSHNRTFIITLIRNPL